MTDKVKNEYVSNKELYQAICVWKEKCKTEDRIVKQCDVIGKAIMLIAEGLSKRFNFSGYTASWKEEMIADGIEASIKGLINFDETKYKNPHAYITTACFNAFVQRIKREQKEMAKIYKLFFHNVYDAHDSEMTAIADEAFIQDIYDKLQKYEASAKSTTKKTDVDTPNLDFLYDETT